MVEVGVVEGGGGAQNNRRKTLIPLKETKLLRRLQLSGRAAETVDGGGWGGSGGQLLTESTL